MAHCGVKSSCIALSRQENDDTKQKMRGVGGHSLGNLILKGLQDINNGDLLLAIEDAQELLDTAGRVLPVTLAQTTICADLEDGTTICDETEIDTRGKKNIGELSPIERLRLEPADAPACAQAVRAIRRANTIIIGPGDLYTSLLPNLLVCDIARAVRESEAEKVYVCNLMTKHGETDGYKASDFVDAIYQYLGGRVDRVIVNDGTISSGGVRNIRRRKERACHRRSRAALTSCPACTHRAS